MTKGTTTALGRSMIMAAGVVSLAGCLGSVSVPRMLSRPVTLQAGGLDCVSATLVELGYTITDGDRAIGFIRGERQRLRGLLFLNRHRRIDVLTVSETTPEGSKAQLNVTASRRRSPAQSVDLDRDGRAVQIRQRGGEVGPSDEALADAKQLLERCAGVSVLPRVASHSPAFRYGAIPSGIFCSTTSSPW